MNKQHIIIRAFLAVADIIWETTEGALTTAGAMWVAFGNYTKNTDGSGSAQLGHSDKQGGGNSSWNSSHPSRGCSQPNLVATGGAGLLYCFASN